MQKCMVLPLPHKPMIIATSHETLLPNDDNDIQLVPWRKDAKLLERHPRGFSLSNSVPL
jgi:hypothetical protein